MSGRFINGTWIDDDFLTAKDFNFAESVTIAGDLTVTGSVDLPGVFRILTSATNTNIDATMIGAVLIGTTESGSRRFYPVQILIAVRTATDFTVEPTFSVGTNATDYRDIKNTTNLWQMPDANSFVKYNTEEIISSIPPNTAIYLNITIGATATVYRLDVFIYGFYLEEF